MADYITLLEARAFLQLDDGEAEAELQAAIDAATDACINVMNRDVSSITATQRISGGGGRSLSVNNTPITAVASIVIADVAVDLTDAYFTDTMIYRKTGIFPVGMKNIVVTYTGGYENIPTPVKRAVLYTLKAMWGARGVDMNTSGESFPGVQNAQFWQQGPGFVPPAAQNLLNNYAARFRV